MSSHHKLCGCVNEEFRLLSACYEQQNWAQLGYSPYQSACREYNHISFCMSNIVGSIVLAKHMFSDNCMENQTNVLFPCQPCQFVCFGIVQCPFVTDSSAGCTIV